MEYINPVYLNQTTSTIVVHTLCGMVIVTSTGTNEHPRFETCIIDYTKENNVCIIDLPPGTIRPMDKELVVKETIFNTECNQLTLNLENGRTLKIDLNLENAADNFKYDIASVNRGGIAVVHTLNGMVLIRDTSSEENRSFETLIVDYSGQNIVKFRDLIDTYNEI